MTSQLVMSLLKDVSSNDNGATMVEYAIMVSLIVAVAYGTVQLLGQDTLALFQLVVSML